MGIRRFDYTTCTKCRICERVCQMDVIRMDKVTGWPVIQYLAECMSCFLCERDCPEGSIYVSPARESRVPTTWTSGPAVGSVRLAAGRNRHRSLRTAAFGA